MFLKALNLSCLTTLFAYALSACPVSAAKYELWAAGLLFDSQGDAIARYDAKDGTFLGYFMHPTPGTGIVVKPGDGGEIFEVETHANLVYVTHRAQDANDYLVSRYDYNREQILLNIIIGPEGNWYRGFIGYGYPIQGLGFTANHIYLLAGIWSTEPRYPELDRGAYVFRHHFDGTIAGIQPDTPSGYSRGAQFSEPPPLAGITASIDLAIDSAGNIYAAKASPYAVYRFAPDGQYYGPGGLGDDTVWIGTNDIPANYKILDIIVDSEDRLYLGGDAGGVVSGYVLRFNPDRSPAPAPGESGAIFAKWAGYGKGVVLPQVIAISPLDNHLYVGNCYDSANENMINRFYTRGENDGKIVEEGGFANLGGAEAPLRRPNRSLLFVKVLPAGTIINFF